MFDDARFYEMLANDPKSCGKKKCADSPMLIAVGAVDLNDDLLDAMEHADDYLLDEESLMAA